MCRGNSFIIIITIIFVSSAKVTLITINPYRPPPPATTTTTTTTDEGVNGEP
jgi:hypothetical protein